jgi:hypothetical protein
MPNHDHLFVETPQPNLSTGMQFLNGSYTSYFNRRHRRVGHLFQGRFKSLLIEEDGHYLGISRYIHLNPVRGCLVNRPEDWPWSSYPGYHRKARTLDWVTYSRVLGEFGNTEKSARALYRRFVRQGMKRGCSSPWTNAAAGLIVGSDQFVERIRKMIAGREEDRALPQLNRLREPPRLELIVRAAASATRSDLTDWAGGRRSNDPSRALAAFVARRRFGYPSTLVAEALGYRNTSSVAAALRRIERELAVHRPTIFRIEAMLDHE